MFTQTEEPKPPKRPRRSNFGDFRSGSSSVEKSSTPRPFNSCRRAGRSFSSLQYPSRFKARAPGHTAVKVTHHQANSTNRSSTYSDDPRSGSDFQGHSKNLFAALRSSAASHTISKSQQPAPPPSLVTSGNRATGIWAQSTRAQSRVTGPRYQLCATRIGKAS
jgi:hypothetical protein